VHIDDSSFIGAYRTVPGVTIENDSTVAAAGVVVRDVPFGSLVTANPARVANSNIKSTKCGLRVDERIET
jgi:acetyltransferase-like isoleucine patch superfamily enzyme